VQSPRVLIVTLNWNTSEETVECLDSLLKVVGCPFDLVVVDNASDDGSLDVIRRHVRALGGRLAASEPISWKGRWLDCDVFQVPRHVPEEGDLTLYLVASDFNYGFPGGNNIGIELAYRRGAEYVVLLNNDTVVDPNFLEELVKVADRDASIGIAGSKVYYYDSPRVIQTAGVTVNWILGRFNNLGNQVDCGQFDTAAVRDVVYATSMLVRTSMLEDIGGLEESFVFGIEEYDLCVRATRAGYRVVYVPTSRIWHKGGRSAAKLAFRPETFAMIKSSRGFLGLRYEIALFKKHLPFPLYIIPILSRTIALTLSFARILVLILAGKESVSGATHRGGVDKLRRMDAEKLLRRILPFLDRGAGSDRAIQAKRR